MTDSNSQSEASWRCQFPGVTSDQWNQWKWQLQHRIQCLEELERLTQLTDMERAFFSKSRSHTLPLSITPYYWNLAAEGPLRKTILPRVEELTIGPEERKDPLCEENDSPHWGLVHRYPSRVLFLVTNHCAVYCRYCTRARLVGQQGAHINTQIWEKSLQYITDHPEIREVILSGGEALFLGNGRLEELLFRIKSIPHVKIIRISSKIPVVLPQRIDDSLVALLRRFHPLFLSLHILHPDELTAESKVAIARLVDAGITIASQTVLLKGVNDDPVVIQALMEGLLENRVRPYALYQCDLIEGSAHFRTPIARGLQIIQHLRKFSSGLAIPHFIADPPGGKVTLAPNNVISRSREGYALQNWNEKPVFYPDFSKGVGEES